jgi:hypothetical protein
MMMRAVELANGHPDDQKSAYTWCQVALDVLGTDGYDPVKPWVMKVLTNRQKACDAFLFVNSGRIIGADELLAC